MASLNKVLLIGNLGKDPEVRYTGAGKAVGNFPIATTTRSRNKDTQEFEEKTEWHNIVVWEKDAEHAKQYLSKGRQVYVEGRLQTRSWTDKEGNKRYMTEVVATQVIFLGGGARGTAAGVPVEAGTIAPAPVAVAAVGGSTAEGPPPFDANEDVPF